MRPVFAFATATWLTFLVFCTVSVYGFDVYEHAWGRGGSLRIEAWLSLLAALVASGAFGIGSAFMCRTHSPPTAWMLGVVCSALFAAACWWLDAMHVSGTAYSALTLLVAIGLLAARAGTTITVDQA
jgi:hypothetical protein